jgi:hypothetical protein
VVDVNQITRLFHQAFYDATAMTIEAKEQVMAEAKVGVARKGGAVRLTLPARVANDLSALQKGLGSLAERLGHTACATGCDILEIMQEREFILSEAVALNPQPLPPRPDSLLAGPSPIPWRVSVTIPDAVNNNIESLRKAVAVAVGKLGCSQCCSGFDIAFRREVQTMALDEHLNVARFGGLG